jgi:hypothetical protein
LIITRAVFAAALASLFSALSAAFWTLSAAFFAAMWSANVIWAADLRGLRVRVATAGDRLDPWVLVDPAVGDMGDEVVDEPNGPSTGWVIGF